MKTNILQYLLISIIILGLTACGGGNSGSGSSENVTPNVSTTKPEIIFSKYLPNVNPNLNPNSRTGIWMVYRETTIVSEYVVKDAKEKYIGKLITNELSVIKKNMDDIAILPMCVFYDLHRNEDAIPMRTDKGYKYTYSEDINSPDYTFNDYLEISFSNDNQKLFGEGSHINQNKYHKNSYRNEITKLYAVKISDTANFNLSNEIQYSNSVETELHTETEFSPECIGISKREGTEYKDAIKPIESHTNKVQQFAYGKHSLIGIEVFETNGVVNAEDAQRIGGMYINDENYTRPWKRNTLCLLSNGDCLNQETLNLNIKQNNRSGIAFSTRLDSDDGGFLNTQISAIIHPFEAAQDNEE